MSSSEDGALDVFQLVCNSPSSAVDAYLAGHSSSVDIANDKGDTPLIMAARRGDIAVVQSLIAAGASVHTRNLKGSNPLIAVRQPTAPQSHSAVSGLTEQQHVEASQRETDLGADVNQSTDSSDTALSLAIWQNHTSVCLLLIDSGADVDNVDKFGDTMLLDAAKHGNVAVMTRLLEKQSISVNHSNKKGDTAIIRAAWKGELEALQLLIDRGADVTRRNANGCTALLMAAMHNNRACFDALLAQPACRSPAVLNATDDNGNNALFYLASFSPLHPTAASREQPFWAGMNELIALGIALDTPPNMGNLLLCRAANNGRLDTVQCLCSRSRSDGVDLNFVDPNNKYRPALLAHLQSQADHNMIAYLLERGAAIDAQDSDGNTALILAVRQGLSSVVRLLLDRGARIDLETFKGETALSLAMQQHAASPAATALPGGGAAADGGCLELLTEKTAEKLGWNALLLHAAQYGDDVKLQSWINGSQQQQRRRGSRVAEEEDSSSASSTAIDLDYTDVQGRSALMLAARGGHTQCVVRLLEAGVNVRLRDRDGCSALVAAVRSGHKDIAELIAKWAEEVQPVASLSAGAPSVPSGNYIKRLTDSDGQVGSGSEMENCTRFLLRLGMKLSQQLTQQQSNSNGSVT